MSEESNVVVSSTEKGGSLENEIRKENDSKPALHSNESPITENAEMHVKKVLVQENQQTMEPAQPEQNRPVHGSLKSNEEAADSSPSEQQLSTFDASTETKFLEKAAGGNQPVKATISDGSTDAKSLEKASADDPSVKSITSDRSTDTKSLERAHSNEPSVKSTTSDGSTDKKSSKSASGNEPSVKTTTSDGSTDTKSLERSNDQPAAKSTSTEISPSEVPSSDKGLEEVTNNIQLIYEGLKEMKISTEEIPVSASGKKGRKPLTGPRARSTPALTSPPLTRSRSRDLRKVPSTPSSPKRSASRNVSEGDSDEMKARGRQRAKKN